MRNRFISACLVFVTCISVSGCTSEPAISSSPTESAAVSSDTAPIKTQAAYSATKKLVYVPTYSHIYTRDDGRDFDLTVTLSIRNTDPMTPVSISDISYFDSEGNLIRSYLDSEITLDALTSRSFIVKKSDKPGGSGANFLVEWSSTDRVSEPVIEAVMIGTQNSQGVSFVSRGIVGRPIENQE